MQNQQVPNTENKMAKKTKKQPIEMVKQNSPLDYVFWIIAVLLLLTAIMANDYLPRYWVAANDIWIRVGIIIGCVVVALGLLYSTQQGKSFVQLVKDSRIELRRVIWPTKEDTITTSWQVVVIVFITAFLIWCFDTLFGWLMKLIIG